METQKATTQRPQEKMSYKGREEEEEISIKDAETIQ